MKKLIAFSVLCALVVGAAFADTSIGGAFFIGGKFLSGNFNKGSHPAIVPITNDNDNGKFTLTAGDSTVGGKLSVISTTTLTPFFTAWWRPASWIRFQIGKDGDGYFGGAQITGWGYTAEMKNGGGMGPLNDYNYSFISKTMIGFYDGIGGGTGAPSAVAVSIYPLDGLALNIWVPWNAAEPILRTLSRVNFNAVYKIEEIGTINFAYTSDIGYLAFKADTWIPAGGYTDPSASGKLNLSFYLSAIENMGIDLGLQYQLPFKNKATGLTTLHPFQIGLGYRLGLGDFALKFRAGVEIPGGTKASNGTTTTNDFIVAANIMPSYKIDIATIFFYAGIGLTSPKTGDSTLAWFVNPFVRFSTGGGNFLVGFQLYSAGTKVATVNDGKPVVNFAIPFGYFVYF